MRCKLKSYRTQIACGNQIRCDLIKILKFNLYLCTFCWTCNAKRFLNNRATFMLIFLYARQNASIQFTLFFLFRSLIKFRWNDYNTLCMMSNLKLTGKKMVITILCNKMRQATCNYAFNCCILWACSIVEVGKLCFVLRQKHHNINSDQIYNNL